MARSTSPWMRAFGGGDSIMAKMFGTPAWQIGFINEYFTERLREALKETAKKKRSLDDLEP